MEDGHAKICKNLQNLEISVYINFMLPLIKCPIWQFLRSIDYRIQSECSK